MEATIQQSQDTCQICGADHYADHRCFWCWWHRESFLWTDDQCRAHEAAIAEMAREADYDRYRFGQEL